MITLRPYQSEGLEEIRSRFRAEQRAVLYQCPTGAGKGVMMAKMAESAAANNRRAIFVVHRDYLMAQSSTLFRSLGIPHGLISPQYNMSAEPIQIASVMTLVRRMAGMPEQDLIIFDEAHRTLANSHMRVVEQWPRARIVGLTASPQRLDGKPLGTVYDSLVEGPSMRWLIENGFLCDFEIYAPPSPGLDMSGVRTRFGDYERAEAERRINRPSITGSAVDHYLKLLGGKRAVVFCASIKHSKDVVSQFNAAGIPAAHIDGTFDASERRQVIAAFARGDLKILSNVELVIEGFDLPAVEGVILLRPTQSVVIFLQTIGRALRPAPGKERAIILDHVGATAIHGFPDEDREWSLDGAPDGPKGPGLADRVRVVQCEACYFVFELGPEACPSCSAPISSKIRKITEVDGDLCRLEREQMLAREREKKLARTQQGQTKTLEELVELGRAKGYKNPRFWAEKVFAGRRRG